MMEADTHCCGIICRQYTGQSYIAGDGRVIFLEMYKGENPYAQKLISNIRASDNAEEVNELLHLYHDEMARCKANDELYEQKERRLHEIMKEYNYRKEEARLLMNYTVNKELAFVDFMDDMEMLKRWYAMNYRMITDEYQIKIERNNAKYFDYYEDAVAYEKESSGSSGDEEVEEEDYDY